MADCKRKTANLFGGTLVQGAVTDAGILVSSSTRVRGEYIPVQPNAQYTLSTDQSIKCIYAYNNQERVDLIFSIGATGRHEQTFTTPDNCDSICIAIMSNKGVSEDTTPQDVEFVMFNTGSTALPYEPYGWVHSLRKFDGVNWIDATVKEWDGSDWQ